MEICVDDVGVICCAGVGNITAVVEIHFRVDVGVGIDACVGVGILVLLYEVCSCVGAGVVICLIGMGGDTL